MIRAIQRFCLILQVPVFKEFVIFHLGMIRTVFKDIPLERIEELRINIENKLTGGTALP